MKKKNIIVFVIILTIILSSFNVFAYAQEKIIKGIKCEDLNNLILKEEYTKIQINRINYTGNKFYINGLIDGAKSIELFGKMYNSNLHENKIVMDGYDNLNNFEVIYMAITKNISSSELEVSKELKESDVLQIYLRDLQDNNYYFYEISIKELNIDCYVFDDYGEYNENQYIIDHWWMKVYEPIVKVKENNIEDKMVEEFTIGILGAREHNTIMVYYDERPYRYEMDVRATLKTYDVSDRPTSDEYILEIYDQRQYYNDTFIDDIPILLITDADMEISLINNWRETGEDIIENVSWDYYSSYYTSGINIDISISLYNLINFSYYTSSSRDEGSISFPDGTKAMSVFMQKPLKNVGNQYNLKFDVVQNGDARETRLVRSITSFSIGLINHQTIISRNNRIVLSAAYDVR